MNDDLMLLTVAKESTGGSLPKNAVLAAAPVAVYRLPSARCRSTSKGTRRARGEDGGRRRETISIDCDRALTAAAAAEEDEEEKEEEEEEEEDGADWGW